MSNIPKTRVRSAQKDDFIAQGAMLAIATVLTKVIGVIYRIPLANTLGDTGNGFYGYAYQIYAMALMVSSLRETQFVFLYVPWSLEWQWDLL